MLNVNGLRGKWAEVSVYLSSFDIFTFVETKIDEKVTNGSLTISGYNITRHDRNSNGGGVITYCKTHLNPVSLECLQSKAVKDGLEVTVTKISLRKPFRIMIIIGVYRPPQARVQWFSLFNELVLDAAKLGEIFICGDLNADLMKDSQYPGSHLLHSLALANCKVSATCPTRIHVGEGHVSTSLPHRLRRNACSMLSETLLSVIIHRWKPRSG